MVELKTNISNIKNNIAKFLDLLFITDILIKFQRYLLPKHIRSVNYHDLMLGRENLFEEHIKFFVKNYQILGRQEIESYFDHKDNTKPGLLITFDDGLLSHYNIAYKILEKYGLKAFFMVPGGFIVSKNSIEFAKTNHIDYYESPAKSVSMNLQQLKEVSINHEICCHTWNHIRLTPDLTQLDYIHEISDAKEKLSKLIDKNVDSFCWVGGEEYTYSKGAFAEIKRSNYTLCFTSNNSPLYKGSNRLFINRTNIEYYYPLYLMKFQVSGLMDLLYIKKRKRVAKIINAD